MAGREGSPLPPCRGGVSQSCLVAYPRLDGQQASGRLCLLSPPTEGDLGLAAFDVGLSVHTHSGGGPCSVILQANTSLKFNGFYYVYY